MKLTYQDRNGTVLEVEAPDAGTALTLLLRMKAEFCFWLPTRQEEPQPTPAPAGPKLVH